MKLSEAIRLGAMLRPQTTGAIYKHGKSCAWGAAWEAVGGDIEHWIQDGSISSQTICEQYWPELNRKVAHPLVEGEWSLASTIESLNDNPHCWTRERIADWVASIEAQQTVIALEPIHEEVYSEVK